MYVCICIPTTERQVQQAVAQGCKTISQVRKKTGACSECGRCAVALQKSLRSTLERITTSPEAEATLCAA
jgi:bacterioferritin-associated ferredoxin